MPDQQNAYLKAMGIDIWVERIPSLPAENIPLAEPEPELKPEPSVSELITETGMAINVDLLDWQELRSAVSACQSCELSINRTKTIFGAGKQTASLMIIGDAPSEEDERFGEPFSGEAGKLLTAMLKAMGYERNDVYISSLVKCRTPGNQDPSIAEVAACESYLIRQIQLLQPNLILALGSVTAQRLLKSKSTMTRLRGQLHYVDNINVPIIVSFEPAYLLRSPNEKRKAWEDLQMAMKELSIIDISIAALSSDKEQNI